MHTHRRFPSWSRSLAALTLLTTVLAGASACGECSFEETISGIVRDATTGAPFEGVVVEVCYGDRCTASPHDQPCASTPTDADGRFTLDVPMCRPRPGQCELRPLVIIKEGCDTVTVQPERGQEAVIELECGG